VELMIAACLALALAGGSSAVTAEERRHVPHARWFRQPPGTAIARSEAPLILNEWPRIATPTPYASAAGAKSYRLSLLYGARTIRLARECQQQAPQSFTFCRI